MSTFPRNLYVNKKLDGDECFDAYETWEDSEPGETVAVYHLDYVAIVKDKTVRKLVAQSSKRAQKQLTKDDPIIETGTIK